MRRSISVPDDLDRDVLDLRAFFMKVLGRDLDYTHALNYLGRLGFEELARSEFGPRSIEILEREFHLDSSAKASLPVSWKKWRGGNVDVELSIAVAPRKGGLSEPTRPHPREVEKSRPKVVGYCPKCRKKTEMKNAKATRFKNGANGYIGTCSVCGGGMVKLGG